MKRQKKTRLTVETLETRNLMTVWGMAWANAEELTVSFVPDGTLVDGQQSTLHQTFGGSETSTWQADILRALQTWAVNANINLHVVPDSGDALGTPGALQGDSRFGDIRIAAVPMGTDPLDQQHIAITAPYSPLVGTRSGDIVFNSNQPFGGDNYDVFTVALHEAGHVFGFADQSTDPTSANYYGYLGPLEGLSAGDIVDLQAIYGARTSDSYEASFTNDTIADALQIGQPNIAADITTLNDGDFYQYTVPSYANSTINVTVHTVGLSLMAPRLSVYDAEQQLVATTSEADPVTGNVSLSLTDVLPGTVFYFQVESATSDVFGVGGYRLKIDSGEISQAEIAAIDVLLDGSVATTETNGQTVSSATELDQEIYATDGQFNYGLTATFGSDEDTHFYSVVTPEGNDTEALLFAVTADVGSAMDLRIGVYDATGQPVEAEVLSNDDGTFVVQVLNPIAEATYYIEVRPDAAAANGTYVMAASFRNTPIVLDSVVSNTLDDTDNAQVFALESTNVQVYHFVLTVGEQGAGAQVAVRMNLYDENNNIVLTLDALAGETVTANISLGAQTYRARFFAATETGEAIPNISFDLVGTALTNPMDPIPINPDDPNLPPPPPPETPPIIATQTTGETLPPIDPTSNPWTPPTTMTPPL